MRVPISDPNEPTVAIELSSVEKSISFNSDEPAKRNCAWRLDRAKVECD
jgi:hypothetical protein